MDKVKKIAVILLMAVTAMALIGCSKSAKKEERKKEVKQPKTPDFVLNSDNSFDVLYEEDFKEDYYNKDELETMIDSEIQEFNATYVSDGQGGIAKVGFVVDSGRAKLTIRFENAKNYIDYETNYVDSKRNARIFIGSCSDAVASGYQFLGNFKSADGNIVNISDIISDGSAMVIFTNQNFNVDVPGEILAMSSYVSIDTASGAVLTSDRHENYIVFRKTSVETEASTDIQS